MNRMTFLEPGRAARVAQALSKAGHRVTWSPTSRPEVVETDANGEEVKRVSAATPGADPEWRKQPGIGN